MFCIMKSCCKGVTEGCSKGARTILCCCKEATYTGCCCCKVATCTGCCCCKVATCTGCCCTTTIICFLMNCIVGSVPCGLCCGGCGGKAKSSILTRFLYLSFLVVIVIVSAILLDPGVMRSLQEDAVKAI